MMNTEEIINTDKRKIMIVEDNPQYVYALKCILEKNGFEVTVSMDGIKAVDSIEMEMPDLILLDIMLPSLDGYGVCERLKAEKSTRGIPVIFLTIKTEIEDIVKGFEAGAVDYITKPFNSAELLARVKTHVELKLAREELQTLRGIIPICANCKKIRDDEGFWEQVETFIEHHSNAIFSHSICPDCLTELYPQMTP